MGSRGAIAVSLLWIYVSANIMLFGAEVASEYRQVPESGYDQPVMGGLKPRLAQRAWEAFRALFVRTRKPDVRTTSEEPSPEAEPVSTTTRGARPRLPSRPRPSAPRRTHHRAHGLPRSPP